MSLSNTAIVGYDFTVSLADQMGAGSDMVLAGSSSRNSDGLLIRGSATTSGYAAHTPSAPLPVAAQVQRTFTVATVFQSVGTPGSAPTGVRIGMVSIDGAVGSATTFAGRLLCTTDVNEFLTRNGGANAFFSLSPAPITYSELYDGNLHVLIYEVRNNGVTIWLDNVQRYTNTAQSWSNFTWGAAPQIGPWAVFNASTSWDVRVKAQVFWSGSLSTEDRTALQTDFKEFYTAAPSAPFRPYFITG